MGEFTYPPTWDQPKRFCQLLSATRSCPFKTNRGQSFRTCFSSPLFGNPKTVPSISHLLNRVPLKPTGGKNSDLVSANRLDWTNQRANLSNIFCILFSSKNQRESKNHVRFVQIRRPSPSGLVYSASVRQAESDGSFMIPPSFQLDLTDRSPGLRGPDSPQKTKQKQQQPRKMKKKSVPSLQQSWKLTGGFWKTIFLLGNPFVHLHVCWKECNTNNHGEINKKKKKKRASPLPPDPIQDFLSPPPRSAPKNKKKHLPKFDPLRDPIQDFLSTPTPLRSQK